MKYRELSLSFLFIVSIIIISSCASSRRGVFKQEGVASWYGPGFHGKKTANGERYNQRRMTAAHKTLPFNTEVKVTNLDNGRSVVVRINDRGPYVDDRIIDLSKKAARKLGMLQTGTARVRLVARGVKATQGNVKASRSQEQFSVQIASFNSKREADSRARKVKGAFVVPAKVGRKTVYRVFVGKYNNRDAANSKLKELKRQGIDGFVKQLQN